MLLVVSPLCIYFFSSKFISFNSLFCSRLLSFFTAISYFHILLRFADEFFSSLLQTSYFPPIMPSVLYGAVDTCII